MAAISKDWLERFEPLRPSVATRFTQAILCRERGTRAEALIREVRPAAWRHVDERGRALASLAAEVEVLEAVGSGSGACFPRLIDAALDGDTPWLAVERCDGPTLLDLFLPASRRRPAEGGWTLPRAVAAIQSLRPGLLALHRRGTAHGRIHPGALVVAGRPDEHQASPRLRLADAGWGAAPRDTILFPDDELLPFLPPAALEKPGPPPPWTDAWSLAAVLVWCLGGRAPAAMPESRLAHVRRAALRRRLRAGDGAAGGLDLPPAIAALLRDTLAGGPSDAAAPNAGEPLASFFEALAVGLEAARADTLWSVAALPDPDLAALRESLRRPPSREALAQHDEAWRRWRAAARRMLDAFDALDVSGLASSFAALRAAFDPIAAECLQQQAGDDPARRDADLMAARLRDIGAHVARLDRLASEGVRALRDGLATAGRDLEGALPAADVTLAAEIETFRVQVERLGSEPPSVELFVTAALLRPAADRLLERAGAALSGERRDRAAAAFEEAVRREDWAEADVVLKRWPDPQDPGAGGRTAGLAAWRVLAAPAEALLAAPPTLESARQQIAAAAKLVSGVPAGFEAAAGALADRLRRPLAAAREGAGRAVETARREAASHAPAAERAAERSLMTGVVDRAGAEAFCRTLERLEKEAAAAASRLDAERADVEALFAIPARLEATRRAVAEARHAWWPRPALPLARREWEAWSERAQKLLRKGERGLRQAREMLENDPPPGWEDAARRMIEASAPSAPAAVIDGGGGAAGSPDALREVPESPPVRARRPTVTAAAPARARPGEGRRVGARLLSIAAIVVIAASAGLYIALRPDRAGESVPQPRRAGTAVDGTSSASGSAAPGDLASAPAIDRQARNATEPEPPGPDVPAPAAVAEEGAWIFGPALPELTLRLTPDGGSPSSTRLPGRVLYPPGAGASFELTWSGGAGESRRSGRLAPVTSVSLQAEIDGALSGEAPPAGVASALEAAVAGWATAVVRSAP